MMRHRLIGLAQLGLVAAVVLHTASCARRERRAIQQPGALGTSGPIGPSGPVAPSGPVGPSGPTPGAGPGVPPSGDAGKGSPFWVASQGTLRVINSNPLELQFENILMSPGLGAQEGGWSGTFRIDGSGKWPSDGTGGTGGSSTGSGLSGSGTGAVANGTSPVPETGGESLLLPGMGLFFIGTLARRLRRR